VNFYFDSYAKKIDGKTLIIASPAKHKFLQRRQYTRIKFMHDFEIFENNKGYKISTLDISAGGMKFKTSENLNIEGEYSLALPLTDEISINCKFKPIRIEKVDSGYNLSGQFVYTSSADRMFVTQFCAKRSVEIKNK
jgi:c-di-GMP-binding flagellar brake protein YcgR